MSAQILSLAEARERRRPMVAPVPAARPMPVPSLMFLPLQGAVVGMAAGFAFLSSAMAAYAEVLGE